MKDIELFNDHFQNYKVYGIPKAQLVIADIPYNIGKDAYGSNPMWYKDGDFFSANNLPIYTLRITDVKYLDILFRPNHLRCTQYLRHLHHNRMP